MCVHISRGVHMVCVCVHGAYEFCEVCECTCMCVCSYTLADFNAATCFIIPRLFSISSLNARNHCAVDG